MQKRSTTPKSKRTSSSASNSGPLTRNVLQTVSQACRDISAQTDRRRLLAITLRHISSLNPIVKVSELVVQGTEAGATLQPGKRSITSHPSFSLEMLKSLERTFAGFSFDDPESREGLFHIDLQGQSVALARVGDQDGKVELIAWAYEKPVSNTVTADLIDTIVRQMQHIATWQNRLDQSQNLVYRDDLTDLFNSRYLEIALDQEIRRSQRFRDQFAVLFLDLDNLKPINDVHGHLAGSAMLRKVAAIMAKELREIDTIIRYGGDEFVAILLAADQTIGASIAERLRKRLAETTFDLGEGIEVSATCSIGVAVYPQHGHTRSALIRSADQAMYVSKKSGKNRVSMASATDVPAASASVSEDLT